MASQTRSKKSSRSDTVGQEAMSADATMSCFERLLDKKLSELKADLATKDCIKELKDIITVQKNRIDELESKIVIMEKLIENLREDNDDTQQYQRRLCLRIGGVELTKGSNGESGEECLKIVKKIFKELNVSVPDTVAHKCQGKTFFPKTKLSFPRQNFLSKDKTFFLKAKLSFPRQNFLSQGKTFFPKTKLSSPRQNFLSQGKTFFSKTKLFSQDKTSFLKAKLSFPRQNSFLKTKLFSQYKTFFPKAKLSYSRQNFLSQGKFSFSRQNFFLKAKLSAPAFFHTGACVVANVST